jgi:hypothetical protein
VRNEQGAREVRPRSEPQANEAQSDRKPHRAIDRRSKVLILWVMGAGVSLSGIAFAYKLASFIFAMTSDEHKGTFDVGIAVYLFVALGWFCLLAWCFMTGRFKDMERSSFELLRQEEEYERNGI